MGFGTLFIGYFLLLNINSYTYTDLIAGLIMLLGLYKLSCSSRHFKMPMWASVAFSVYGFIELIFAILELFEMFYLPSSAINYVAIFRAAIICIMTMLILRGIYKLAKELDVERLPLSCRTAMVWTLVVYIVKILLETTILTSLLPAEAIAVLYLVMLFAILAITVYLLVIIYTAYMHICRESDLKPKEKKASPFGFINDFNEKRDERRREEEEEYRRDREEKERKKNKK